MNSYYFFQLYGLRFKSGFWIKMWCISIVSTMMPQFAMITSSQLLQHLWEWLSSLMIIGLYGMFDLTNWPVVACLTWLKKVSIALPLRRTRYIVYLGLAEVK